MEEKLVSIVIPCYNRADRIMPSLMSVLAQTYPNIEVIVVDDGSTDETQRLFENFSDDRVTYLRYMPNKGACHARNYGAERAHGEYIAFQDSDDIWLPDKLRRQLHFMAETGAGFVYCGMNRLSPSGGKYYFPVHGFTGKDPVTELLLENRVGTQTMLMHRDVWARVRFDDSFRRYQDWDFAIRTAKVSSMAYLAEALVVSEVNSDSISASINSYDALKHLYDAHREDFDSRPRCLAMLYRRMGKRLKNVEPALAAEYFLKSLKLSRYPYDLFMYLKCRISTKIITRCR